MTERSDESAQIGPKPQILSVTKYIPYTGIGHAGGQYALDHYQALEQFADLVVVGPSTPDNVRAARLPGAPSRVLLIEGMGWGARGRMKVLTNMYAAWQGSNAPRYFSRAVERGAIPADILATASVIEVQWSEMASVLPDLVPNAPQARTVIVAHDVITQRWERASVGAGNPASRFAFRVAAKRSRRRESRDFGSADAVLVFSEKDASLVRALTPRAAPLVVHPGFDVGTNEPDPSTDAEVRAAETAPTVLFTGALARSDNARAVTWFLKEVWPLVLAEVPTAQFVAAGSGPPARLQKAVADAQSARLTGRVPSLSPFYASADAFVVPLLTGAGVKFKTIEALMRGLPTVTTTVGAEGIERHDVFVGVEDEPKEFALKVVDALLQDQADLRERARLWASATYSRSAFAARLRDVYRQLSSQRLT